MVGEARAEGRPPVAPRIGGADRETLNRACFALFAGVRRSSFDDAARQWYAHCRSGPRAYLSETLDALRRHQRDGDEVALVSGSGEALVRPVADDLGVRHVLATEQLSDAAGVLTGEVRRPMIGAAKGEAAASLVRRLDVRAQDCWAYGDHATDLPMLSLVGRPVVVGDDPLLAVRGAATGLALPRHADRTTLRRTDRIGLRHTDRATLRRSDRIRLRCKDRARLRQKR